MGTFTPYDRTETVHFYDDDFIFLFTEVDLLIPEGTDIPGRSTLIAPPATGTNQAAQYNPGTEIWTVVEDYRGQTIYSTTDQSPVVVEAVGAVPVGYTLLVPATTADEWNGSAWATNLSLYREQAEELVDIAAGQARQRGLDFGALHGLELEQLQRVYDAWVAAGSNLGALPPEIQVHVDEGGLSAADAVTAVTNDLALVASVIQSVYVERITGHYAIQGAGTIAFIETARDGAITTINGLYTS